MNLQDKVSAIKGVGDKKRKLLNNMNIDTIDDLLHLFPKKYEDRRQVSYIMEAPFDKDVLIKGKVIARQIRGNPYNKKTPLRILVQDESAELEVLFFNGRYLANYFNIGSEYTFYGKITLNGGRRQMAHPEFHKLGDKDDVRGILPIYPLTEGITQANMRKMQMEAAILADEEEEWLPDEIVRKYNLCSPAYAIKNVHFPKDERNIREGRYRLIFEELLVLQTGLFYIKKGQRESDGIIIPKQQISADDFLERLPFELTDGQKRVWEEVQNDMSSSRAMNRLVQGDVGSGKTVVAELAMYKTVKAGFQAVMMAPTELLAKQHFASLKRDFEPFGLNVGLLCSSMKSKEKKQTLENLEAGTTDILVGTHAIIQPGVKFRSLGMVVTDEQHRFGVNQRSLLAEKGHNPNVLVMTATPIPRTLAVILYGDLDISVIDTMPKGRQPVKTFLRNADSRDAIYEFVYSKVKEGRQAYVVAPLIEESESIDCRSAEEIYEELKTLYTDIKIGLIHGAMKQEEKDRVMESFASGNTDIIVSTVVIEVGIDVANATVMVIENCERFGLAQLHQLRGRVGRGKHQSYCILISGHESKVSRKRNEIMCSTEDGFVIAEEDLKLRGPGEIFGTRQHGLPELNISDLIRHGYILEKAKQAAGEIIEEDRCLEKKKYFGIRKRIKKMFGENIRLNL
ncbi:MAG: DNA helicase RecG [Clostridiales bacterium]|nr:ATP-dependent DNA helicase RecG [Bacillota bacterium]MEE0517697.1 ATP-dependent DNA helicase RecG [Anaerovoracaceae bacterium]PWL94584.1 MAG: DNA helicase RecG [Clostridiales bacterium]